MSFAEDTLSFSQAASAVTTINALSALTERTVRALGFDHFALIHHVNIKQAGGETVFLHNYPDAWAATVHVREYMRDDPLAEVCRRQSAPFLWSEMSKLIDLSPRQREIMRAARRAGLAQGYTVPVHKAGETIGSCSFSTSGALPLASLPAVALIGILAFDAARRLVRRSRVPATHPRLTPRERDCILLAARGNSDLEASQILGIAQTAVTRHIEDARRKYGAATPIELIVRALYRAELKFAELIDVEDELSGTPVTRRGETASDEPAPMARLGALFFGTNPHLN